MELTEIKILDNTLTGPVPPRIEYPMRFGMFDPSSVIVKPPEKYDIQRAVDAGWNICYE